MLSLAFPWALLLLPAPFLIWRFVPPYRVRVPAIRIPFFRSVTEKTGIQAHTGSLVASRDAVQFFTAALVWVLLVLALARPERLGEPIVIETAARDIVIALDISGSMDQRDFVASDGSRMQRLDAVKDVLRDFIAQRDGDRMALIVFGTRAFVQAPFTEDLQSLDGFLDLTEAGMAGPNTALGDAIGLSVRTFESSEVEQRLLILLSDGADTSSRMTPVNAAAIAAERNVVIQAIGVGDPEASGDERVDLDALKDIAGRTGGTFFYAGDETALKDVYTQIDALNPRVTETTSFRPRVSLVHLPLAVAVIVILATLGWLHFRRRASVG